jgi:hypothetical protein
VFALDVGATKRFVKDLPPFPYRPGAIGWATRRNRPAAPPAPNPRRARLADLVQDLAAALSMPSSQVHFYVEAPLFVAGDPASLGLPETNLLATRPFEDDNVTHWAGISVPTTRSGTKKQWPWYSGGGGSTLAAATQELPWLLRQLALTASLNNLAVKCCPDPDCPDLWTKGARDAAGTLVIMEVFSPRGWDCAKTHNPAWVGTWPTDHLQVAQRVLDVAAHLGWIPHSGNADCAITRPACSAPPPKNPAWYDTTNSVNTKTGHPCWPGGTLNLVAAALFNADLPPRPGARTAHGVVFWP